MKVVHVSFSYDKKIKTEEDLLEQHYTVTGWAEALQRQGVEIIVINRFFKESSLQKNNVQYYFIKDRFAARLRGWHLPRKLFKKIKDLDADVIHLHNLTLSVQTFFLRKILKKKTAIIVQHHGGIMPGKKKRWIHNRLNSVADGFFFTTVEQGKEWFMNDRTSEKVKPVMEGATFFNYADRNSAKKQTYPDRKEARNKTGMTGSPIFLWVGRLDNNKDPLTVLTGFEILFEKYKDASLYMVYSDDKLAGEVKKKINGTTTLKHKVHLLGKIDHDKIEQYYNSADYFILGSHYEGSGYALSEALRCGCVPVITNIPSFRMMTNNGQLGALWEPGDEHSFIRTASIAMNKSLKDEANKCIDFFKENLSFDAIAQTALMHYQKVIELRSRKMKKKND